MAKLIITNDYAHTNMLIELEDGSQVEVNVHRGGLIKALNDDEQSVYEVNQLQPKRVVEGCVFEIKVWDEKDGNSEVSDFNHKPITDETLDFVLDQLIANFGFAVLEVRKDGKVLSEKEVREIIKKYPCDENNFEELHAYFFGKQ